MGRILIADDHDALRRGLVRGLTEAKHEVEEASNGNAAIERLVVGPAMDQLQLRRLKKRKLALKDIIDRLESKLIPDQPA